MNESVLEKLRQEIKKKRLKEKLKFLGRNILKKKK
jgi:hypothetical protein